MNDQLALIETVLVEPPVPVVDRWAIAGYRRDSKEWKLYGAWMFDTREAAVKYAGSLPRSRWRLVTVVRLRLGE